MLAAQVHYLRQGEHTAEIQAIEIAWNKSTHLALKSNGLRVEAARMLVALRVKIEEEGKDWWPFYRDCGGFSHTRKDAEKLLKIGGAPDPEAAHEEEKAETKERMRGHRAHVRGDSGSQNESSTTGEEDGDPVSKAVTLIQGMTAEERHLFCSLTTEVLPWREFVK